MTNEMIKLRELLDNFRIIWEGDSDPSTIPEEYRIDRTLFEDDGGHMFTVIHGKGSYGGIRIDGVDGELLELMSGCIAGGEPLGYLTAKDIVTLLILNKHCVWVDERREAIQKWVHSVDKASWLASLTVGEYLDLAHPEDEQDNSLVVEDGRIRNVC
jgi:hypothetical protein